MLRLLLDEHISPDVADGLRRRAASLVVHCLAELQSGILLGKDDSVLLEHAARQRLTLVTYDLRTIPPLLKSWTEAGRTHGGVIFVDEKTISPADIGGLIQALLTVARQTKRWDWTDRICFLRRQPAEP
jgi:hypothetical protein